MTCPACSLIVTGARCDECQPDLVNSLAAWVKAVGGIRMLDGLQSPPSVTRWLMQGPADSPFRAVIESDIGRQELRYWVQL